MIGKSEKMKENELDRFSHFWSVHAADVCTMENWSFITHHKLDRLPRRLTRFEGASSWFGSFPPTKRQRDLNIVISPNSEEEREKMKIYTTEMLCGHFARTKGERRQGGRY